MNPDIMLMLTVLMLILLDIITGLIKAVAGGNFSSAEMRMGLLRKCGTIALLLMAYGLQYVAGHIDALPDELTIVYSGVSIYIILMEIASNVENILVINPELGSDTVKRFFGLGGKDDNAD